VTLVAAVHAPPELLPLPPPELLPDEVPLLEPEPELPPLPEPEPLLDDPCPPPELPPLELPLLPPELLPLDPPPPASALDPGPPSPLVLSTASRPVHAAPSANTAAIAIQCLMPGRDVMGFPCVSPAYAIFHRLPCIPDHG